jgi:hypothetical protein
MAEFPFSKYFDQATFVHLLTSLVQPTESRIASPPFRRNSSQHRSAMIVRLRRRGKQGEANNARRNVVTLLLCPEPPLPNVATPRAEAREGGKDPVAPCLATALNVVTLRRRAF